VYLSDNLRDPLWLNKIFTTKEHKGKHKGTQRYLFPGINLSELPALHRQDSIAELP